jgi:DNA-binding NarL/FixJ family response regulator
MRAKIILADDHRLLAEALGRILETDYELSAVVENGVELLDKVQSLKPDLVLVDISMPEMNGIEAARRIKQVAPATHIIFLSMHSDPHYVSEALRAGGHGYVLKRCAVSEIPKAISAVLGGMTYISPLISGEAVQAVAHNREVLTARQREVLQLIAEGKSAKEIATSLHVSVKTAEFHRASIMDRLGMRTTAELTKYALEHGMTPAM